jgi:hypothetical protein
VPESAANLGYQRWLDEEYTRHPGGANFFL